MFVVTVSAVKDIFEDLIKRTSLPLEELEKKESRDDGGVIENAFNFKSKICLMKMPAMRPICSHV